MSTYPPIAGYVHCACPDCFEIAVAGDDSDAAMCSECEESGCDGESECEAPHAYDQHCGDPDCCGEALIE